MKFDNISSKVLLLFHCFLQKLGHVVSTSVRCDVFVDSHSEKKERKVSEDENTGLDTSVRSFCACFRHALKGDSLPS